MPLLTELWRLEQGYRSAFSSLFLSHTDSFSLPPPSLAHGRLSFLLSPNVFLQCFLFSIFLFLPTSNSTHLHHALLLLSILTFAYTSPSVFPPLHLLLSSPVSPSSWFHGHLEETIQHDTLQFPKYVYLIQTILRHKPGSYFLFLWCEAAKCHPSPLDRTPVSHGGLVLL